MIAYEQLWVSLRHVKNKENIDKKQDLMTEKNVSKKRVWLKQLNVMKAYLFFTDDNIRNLKFPQHSSILNTKINL